MKLFFKPISFLTKNRFFSSHSDKNNSESITISAKIVSNFSSGIELVRKAAAPGNDTVTVDYLDHQSLHLILSHDSKIISAVRVSSSLNSILKRWYKDYPFPSSSETAELTKAVVLPTYQNKGLYKLMMLEILLRLPEMGYIKATAGIRPSFPHRSFLKNIGFAEHSQIMVVKDQNANFEGIPIYLKYIDQGLIQKMYFHHIDSLKKRGIIVKSDLLEKLALKQFYL